MRSALARLRRRWRGDTIVRDVAGAGASKRALLLYTTRAFRRGFERLQHQNILQQRELAHAIGERGFAVDVVDFDARDLRVLPHDYDLVVDLHPKADPVYAYRVAAGAIRIAYITGSNPRFTNAAEQARLDDLERRRGVRLAPRRQQPMFPTATLEAFDAMFLIGNAVTLATYADVTLRHVFLLPNSVPGGIEATEPARRDATRFLYLGSSGQVHKGLDLLLDAFAATPSLSLAVCGDFARERDFARAYGRELSATPNIRAAGWMDLRGTAFRDLQASCGAMLLPSCAEGQVGTATMALAFGMACGLSCECGLDADPPVTLFPDCSSAAIREACTAFAARPPAALRAASDAAGALIAHRYTHARYAAAVREALDGVLGARATRSSA